MVVRVNECTVAGYKENEGAHQSAAAVALSIAKLLVLARHFGPFYGRQLADYWRHYWCHYRAGTHAVNIAPINKACLHLLMQLLTFHNILSLAVLVQVYIQTPLVWQSIAWPLLSLASLGKSRFEHS